MSYAETFCSEAIESCKIYSNYCKNNEKSQIITRVSRITHGDIPRSFVLHLDRTSSFHSFDSEAICIRLDPDNRLPVSYYDDVDRQYVKHEYFWIHSYLHKEQQLFISVKDEKVLSIFRDHLIENPERICFISDMTFLIDKVKDWYEIHKSKITLPLFGSEISYDTLDQDLFSTLSTSQSEAVRTALASPVSYIWGPPGTGKTWTLAHTVLALIQNNKKVLIVAPTNNAIDNSLRTILKVMETKGVPTDNVIRWGIPTVSFEKDYGHVCDNSAISKMIESYKSRIASCKELLNSFETTDTFNNKASLFSKYKKQYVDLSDSLDREKKGLSSHEIVCSEILGRLHKAKYDAQEANTSLNKLKQRNISLSHFAKIRLNEKYRNKYNQDTANAQRNFDEKNKVVETLNREYAEALNIRHSHNDRITKIKKQIDDCLTYIKKISIDLFGSFSSIAVTEAEILQRQEEHRLNKTKEQLLADIEYYSRELSDIDRVVKQQQNSRNIFACTIDYLFSHYDGIFDDNDPMISHLKIDHVFIDEAALLPMIKAGIAFSFDVPVTMCGDHKQLPPVCEMDDRDIKLFKNNTVYMWAQSSLYFTDIFEHDSEELFYTYINSGEMLNSDLSVSFLKDTFRFGDNLAKILDAFIYQNGFKGTSDTTQITILDAPHITPSVRSRTSMDEVSALKKYLSNHFLEEFVIVTPYKHQRDLLRKELKNIVNSPNIQTIHASQGLEWETVIISVVDTFRPWFCNSGLPMGRNVLNTAISRCIKEIVIVCDYNYWVTHPKQLIGSLAINNTCLTQ